MKIQETWGETWRRAENISGSAPFSQSRGVPLALSTFGEGLRLGWFWESLSKKIQERQVENQADASDLGVLGRFPVYQMAFFRGFKLRTGIHTGMARKKRFEFQVAWKKQYFWRKDLVVCEPLEAKLFFV